MMIAEQVKALPEVGHSVVSQAKRIDARQLRIDEMQAEVDADMADFIAELRQDWSDKTLIQSGLLRP